MKKQKPILSMSIIALITGFLLIVAFRMGTPIAVEDSNKELLAYIDEITVEIELLEQQVLETREAINRIQKTQTDGEYLLQNLNHDLDLLMNKAGLTAASGAGILITLEDNKTGAEQALKSNPENYNPESYIIHDYQLLYIIRAAAKEAEAIAINNQRIVDTSNVRCIGTVIMVNTTPLAPPYEIRIIGNPSALIAAVEDYSPYLELLNKGFPVKITKVEEQALPAYTGKYVPTYAQIPKEGTVGGAANTGTDWGQEPVRDWAESGVTKRAENG